MAKHNWLNNTARDLNGKIFKRRLKISRLKDNERKQTNKNTPIQALIEIENTLIKGKYKGISIGTVLDMDPDYCCWVLEQQPKSVIAQQIILYFSRNPA
jgi:hypothetical protein